MVSCGYGSYKDMIPMGLRLDFFERPKLLMTLWSAKAPDRHDFRARDVRGEEAGGLHAEPRFRAGRRVPSYKGRVALAIRSKEAVGLRPTDLEDKFFGKEQRVPELAEVLAARAPTGRIGIRLPPPRAADYRKCWPHGL